MADRKYKHVCKLSITISFKDGEEDRDECSAFLADKISEISNVAKANGFRVQAGENVAAGLMHIAIEK